MVLDKQRKHYDDSMNQAIKMTRQGYSKSQWERMVKAMEVMQTVKVESIMLLMVAVFSLFTMSNWIYGSKYRELEKKMDELGFTLETQKALVLDGPCLVKRERELMRGVVKC